MLTTQKVTVDQLCVGMYVAQLDRPWLETPFLFQGFYIRDADEIAELKAHCEYVYVTVETLQAAANDSLGAQQATDLSKPRVAPNQQSGFSLRSLFRFWRGKSSDSATHTGTTQVYEDTTSLKEEMPVAAKAQRQAEEAVRGVFQRFREQGTLDIAGLESNVKPMVGSVLRNPAAMACLVRLQKKGDYLYQHSLASAVWATILGRQIGLSRQDLDVLALGALLLDIGKTKVPDEILNKPGKLDRYELKLVRRHVDFGLRILEKRGEVDPRVIDMLAHHHERYNGTGYPQGLKGNEIPVFGRIAGIVDAYDAMISPRPYAKPISSYDALRQLRKLADVEFQSEIVDQFTRAIGVFPTGTLVELSSGEIAVVTKQNAIRPLRPEVMVIMNADKQLLDNFNVRDLNSEKVTSNGQQSLWIECGLPPGTHGIDPTEFYLD